MHGHAKISQYKILRLFIITNYTRVPSNIILDYTKVIQIMPCVKYRYTNKIKIMHMIIITKIKFRSHDTFVTCWSLTDVSVG